MRKTLVVETLATPGCIFASLVRAFHFCGRDEARDEVAMSVVVSVNLADGVILGVDSAITLPGPPPIPGQPLPPNVMHGGVLKVYEGADKLFPLGNLPVGIATYGTAVVGNRTVGNYIRQFVAENPNRVVKPESTLRDIAEELHEFFSRLYKQIVVPVAEKYQGKPFDQIPVDSRPGFGFVIGGFSGGAYLSEVWQVLVPATNEPQILRAQGDFSSNWFALYEPIDRYFKGFSRTLLAQLLEYFARLRGSAFSDAEQKEIADIITSHEFIIPTSAMPISVGIEFARFMVELVINHHRYAIGGPVVGGRARVGVVTDKGTGPKFEIVE